MSSLGSIKIQAPKFLYEGVAACSQADPEMFFPVDSEEANGSTRLSPSYTSLQAAKDVCNGCELKYKCLEYAIKNHEYGIWGGTTEAQRTSLRRSISRSPQKRTRQL